MEDWALKPPHWLGDHLQLLLNNKFEENKTYSIPDIVAMSDKFPLKFPVDTAKLTTLKAKNFVSETALLRNINSTYSFMHEKVLELCAKFLIFKKKRGSDVEKRLYKTMTLKDFIDRLLLKRAAVFVGKYDKYMLMDGVSGRGHWETIGTSQEKPPLTLENCLSYDEIKLSALLNASSYTFFLNDGSRRNMSVYCKSRNDIQEDGIVIGLIGPRMKRQEVMDFQEIVVTEKQNKLSKGYGYEGSLKQVFFDFFEEENVLFETAKKRQAAVRPLKYVNVNIPQKGFFDNDIYYKRLAIVFDCLLLEANFRAKEAGKTAYIHVVGFGLGVWRISDHQEAVFMDSFYKRIQALGPKLTSVSDICFSYINQDTCGGHKHGDVIPINPHPLGGVKIHIFNRQPHEKLDQSDKLLIVSIARDGNALPGNEFWVKNLKGSGDSAAASSTQIAELQNPHVNPLMCANNLKIVTCAGDLVSFREYAERFI